MSEVIAWKALSPWQRNCIVAEKIMGVKDFQCMGKLDWGGENTLLRYRYYLCQRCHVTLTITDAWPENWMPSVHNKLTPRYSESVDAALTLLERFDIAQVLYMKRSRLYRVVVTMAEEDHEATMDNLAEAICIAVLKSVGCEVEL